MYNIVYTIQVYDDLQFLAKTLNLYRMRLRLFITSHHIRSHTYNQPKIKALYFLNLNLYPTLHVLENPLRKPNGKDSQR